MGTYVSDFPDPPFEFGDAQFVSTGAETTRSLVTEKYVKTMAAAEEMRQLFLTFRTLQITQVLFKSLMLGIFLCLA